MDVEEDDGSSTTFNTPTTSTSTKSPATGTNSDTKKRKKAATSLQGVIESKVLEKLDCLNEEEEQDECSAFGEEIARGSRKLSEGYSRECFFQEVRNLLFIKRFGSAPTVPTQMPGSVPAAPTQMPGSVPAVPTQMQDYPTYTQLL